MARTSKRFLDLSKDEEQHALDLYRKSIVIDCHQDSLMTDEYILKMRDTSIAAVNLDGGSFEKMAEKHMIIDTHPDIMTGPISTAQEMVEAKKKGKIAVFLGAESADEVLRSASSSDHLTINLDLLHFFHRLGLRIIQPTYNDRNVFADGCNETANGGLSNLGLELVEKMNRLNLIADCSHVGIKTTLGLCEHARFVVCTHSNARAVCDNVRNRTDEEIKAIAEKDGVMGLVSFPTFVKWTRTGKGEWPTIEDLLDHVDYIDKVIGARHVGVGLDLVEGTTVLGPITLGKGLGRWPRVYGSPGPDRFYHYTEQLDSTTSLPNLAKGLVARGYSDDEIEQVLGENWLRVFRKAWGK